MSVNLEEMAQSYSKKWGVSVEEAKKKIQEFMEKGEKGGKPPIDQAFTVPTIDPFPTPVGEMSRKIMDLNQATLSQAYTMNKLKQLNLPPQELENVKARLDSIEQSMNVTIELVNTRVKALQDTLDTKKSEEDRAKLMQELETKIIAPIKNDLETVKKSIEVKDTGGAATGMKDLVGRLKTAEVDAVQVLQDLGYTVPERRVPTAPPAAAGAPMDVQATIEFLKKQGYRIESDMMTKEEAKKMVEEAKRTAQEEALDDKRITAVTDIIKDSIAQIIEMFKKPMEGYFNTMIQSRQAEPAPASAE